MNTKHERMNATAVSAVLHLRGLSARNRYPLTRRNLKLLFDDVARRLTPYYDDAEEQECINSAEIDGFNLVAMNERIVDWLVNNNLATIKEVQDQFGMVKEEILAGRHLGLLTFVPVPDAVIAAPEKYRPKDRTLNIPESEIDALSDDDLDNMRSNATVTASKLQEYLHLTDEERESLLKDVEPVDWNGVPHTGTPLYPLWFARLVVQAWRQIDDEFDKSYGIRVDMEDAEKSIDFGFIAHGVEVEEWKDFTEISRVMIHESGDGVGYNVSRMDVDTLVSHLKTRARMIWIAEAQSEYLEHLRGTEAEYDPRHPHAIFLRICQRGIEDVRKEVRTLVREIEKRQDGFNIHIAALAETNTAIEHLVATIKAEGIKAP